MNDLRSRLDRASAASPTSSSIYDRLGKRDKSNNNRERLDNHQSLDARDEIERSKQRARKNRPRYREDGYEENGVYHDIYRAADDDDARDGNKIKADPDASDYRRSATKSRRSPYSDDGNNSSSDDDDEASDNRRSSVTNSGRNNIKSRLGKVNSATAGCGDLRDKLRNHKKSGDKRNRSRRNDDNDEDVSDNVKEERVTAEDRSRLNLCIEIKREPDEMDMDFEF